MLVVSHTLAFTIESTGQRRHIREITGDPIFGERSSVGKVSRGTAASSAFRYFIAILFKTNTVLHAKLPGWMSWRRPVFHGLGVEAALVFSSSRHSDPGISPSGPFATNGLMRDPSGRRVYRNGLPRL